MQLKHWQMSISHFHHELDIFYMCLLSFCSEIKTSCHIETLLILKPKSQKTHLSSVQRVVLIWTQQFCRLRSVYIHLLTSTTFLSIFHVFGLFIQRNKCAYIFAFTATLLNVCAPFVCTSNWILVYVQILRTKCWM